MADHRLESDNWVKYFTKDEKDDAQDPTYCTIQSRKHLLYILYYTSELISVAKGIRFLLGIITVLLVLDVVKQF